MDGDEDRHEASDGARVAVRLEPARLAAIVPCHHALPDPFLLEAVRSHVGELLLVADGKPASTERELRRLVERLGLSLLQLPENRGKGAALAAGLRELLAREPPPEAVVVIDADGQHPADAIPAFVEAAADAELVVGDRFADLGAMPWLRRAANQAASRLLALRAGGPVRDSQCGMRLLRGRALVEVAFPDGRYESETRHLKACLRSGVTVAWVPIPAVYGGEPSSFRPVRDSLRVLRALLF